MTLSFLCDVVFHELFPAVLLHEAPGARVIVPGAQVDGAGLVVVIFAAEADRVE